MIKIISSIGAYHDVFVGDAVDELQKEGYDVINIERKKKAFLGFGTDISYIHYREIEKENKKSIGFKK